MAKRPQGSPAAFPERLKSTLLYLVRSLCAIAIGIACLIVIHLEKIRALDFESTLLILASMDIFHALFYGAIPGLLIFWLFPRRLLLPAGSWLRWSIAVFMGGFSKWVLLTLLLNAKNGYSPTAVMVVLCAWLGANVTLLLGFSGPDFLIGSAKWRLVRFAFPVSDLLAPGLVYAEYLKMKPFFGFALRILPVSFFGICLLLSTLLSLPKQTQFPENYGGFSPIPSYPLDSFTVYPATTRKAIWVSKLQSVTRTELKKGYSQSSVEIPSKPVEGRGAYVLSFSNDQRTFYAAGHTDGMISLVDVDAQSMQVTRNRIFPVPGTEALQRSILLRDENRQIALATFDSGFMPGSIGGAVVFSPDMNFITRYNPCGNYYYALLDPNRRLFYACFLTPGMVAAFDPDTLIPKAHLLLPEFAEQMAIDAQRDRLFVSYPIEGVIRVIDLTEFRLIRTLKCSLGVKTIFVDQARSLLLTGGYAPYIETFDLENLIMTARYTAPSWQRSITASAVPGEYYVGSYLGVRKWEIEEGKRIFNSTWLTQNDIYFKILHLILPLAQRALGLGKNTGTDADINRCRKVRIFPTPGIGAILKENPKTVLPLE